MSSGAALQVRLSAACLRVASSLNHAIEQATSRDDDGQPAAEAEQQQKEQAAKTGQLPRPPAAAFRAARRACQWRGACGSLLFRQDKKRKQLPTKNNVEK